MKYEDWLKLREKLRKEADKLIAESEKVYTEALNKNNSTLKTVSYHIDEVVNCLEEAIDNIEYFTDLQ